MLNSDWQAIAERLVREIEARATKMRAEGRNEEEAAKVHLKSAVAFLEAEFGIAAGHAHEATAKGLFRLFDELGCFDLCSPDDRPVRIEAAVSYVREQVAGDF